MYGEAFCKIYNEFGWNYFPLAFGEQLLTWLERESITVRNAMDLGCGTGVLCEVLREHGIESAGMDFSSEMIAIARQRCGDIPYTVGDMTVFHPETTYDLVTSTGDALNHLPKLTDLEKVFGHVFGYLAPGGLFVFDLLNSSEVPADEPIDMDWEDGTRSRFLVTQEEGGIIHLMTQVYRGDELQFEEVITELLHDPYAVRCLLEKSGFRILRFDHRLLDDAAVTSATWFVVAQKPE